MIIACQNKNNQLNGNSYVNNQLLLKVLNYCKQGAYIHYETINLSMNMEMKDVINSGEDIKTESNHKHNEGQVMVAVHIMINQDSDMREIQLTNYESLSSSMSKFSRT